MNKKLEQLRQKQIDNMKAFATKKEVGAYIEGLNDGVDYGIEQAREIYGESRKN